MIAVIFEEVIAPGRQSDYLDLAERLRAEFAHIDGLLSIERFRSLDDPDKLVSLSYWRDEAAVRAWRNEAAHRDAQKAGRGGIFASYRLRVAEVLRDYGMSEREQAPDDSPF